MKFTPKFCSEHEHLLLRYNLRGVGTLESPCLYSDLHAAIPAATLVYVYSTFYKSWHFKDIIFGDARCSMSSAQVFHPFLQANTSWLKYVHHSVTPLPLWGELVTGGSLLYMENKISQGRTRWL
jgi:hypothetical protein